MSEIINLKKKISELEEKLAQSVANNIDLSPNSELDD
nr:MAG TPA: zipper dimerization domain transcription factor-like protein [Bacteriophage sp.]